MAAPGRRARSRDRQLAMIGTSTRDLAAGPEVVLRGRVLIGACALCLLLACSDEQATGTTASTPTPASETTPAVDTVESAPSVVVSGGETLRSWQPPAVEVTPDTLEAIKDEAAKAMQEGNLFGQPRDAIALYLALAAFAPEDAGIRKGLAASLEALLDKGRKALAAVDRDPGQLQQAQQVAAVARAVDPDAEAVHAYLERLDTSEKVQSLLQAGQRDLRAGRFGTGSDQGALTHFRKALELHPDSTRARQGIADVEAALVERAVQAADKFRFDSAGNWLDVADSVRDDGQAVEAARKQVAAMRQARVWQLRDLGIAALTHRDGLADARRRLDELLRLAEPGDSAAAELRERIDLVAHYGLYRPGQTFTDPLQNGGRGPVMVVVPHGGFRMGAAEDEAGSSDAERPQHYVRFDRGFGVSKTEVTVGQFRRFIEATGYETRAHDRGFSTVYDEQRGNMVKHSGVDWRHDYSGAPADDALPVVHVSARDAEAYANWLSGQTGEVYRLPSEAQFEYALRADSQSRFPWGDGPPPAGTGNFTGAGDKSPSGRRWRNAFEDYADGYWGPAPVGSFAANAYGLHGLAGNVSEWVADCWHDGYRRAPDDGRAWLNPGCRTRVLRGGSWASGPSQTRSAWRLQADADTTNARLGFRVVRVL